MQHQLCYFAVSSLHHKHIYGKSSEINGLFFSMISDDYFHLGIVLAWGKCALRTETGKAKDLLHHVRKQQYSGGSTKRECHRARYRSDPITPL
jgi:hypothetical protein